MEYKKLAHATYYCRYHFIFATKYKRKVLKGGMGAYLVKVVRNVTKIFPEVEIIEANTDQDHIHLMISIPPKLTLSEIVQYIKGRSAHDMRKRFPFLKRVYYGTDGLWSEGYFVSTVGINEEIIRRYIEMQGKEDGGQATLEL